MPGRLWQARGDLALATLSGVAVFLSFPNWNLYPLAFVALIPLLIVAERGSARRAFGWGFWMGCVTNAGGFYWVIGLLRDFGYLPLSVSTLGLVLLSLEQAVCWGVAASAGRALALRGVRAIVAYPVALAVAELVTPMIFPWYFGNSQWTNYAFIQSVEIGGVTLISGLLVVANVSLLSLARRVRRGGPLPVHALVGLGLLAANLVYGAIRIVAVDARTAEAPRLAIGLVEADIGIYEKADPARVRDNLLIHQNLSAQLAEQGAQLILWPETAYLERRYHFTTEPVASLAAAREAAGVSPRLDRQATWLPPSSAPLVASAPDDDERGTVHRDRAAPQRGFRTPMLFGTLMWSLKSDEQMRTDPPRRGRPRPYVTSNSALLIDDGGRVLGAYDKNLLMPFSEHVWLGHEIYQWTGVNLYDIIPSAGDFLIGEPPEALRLPRPGGEGEYRLGVMICYEDIMADFGRTIHRASPDILLNLTNDAWFGKTAEPYLHLALSIFRTIEQRTYLVRSTNTGVSVFVDPVGRVVAETSLDDAETLLHDTPMVRATRTPFMVFGHWPAGLGLVWCLASVFRARRRRRQDADLGSDGLETSDDPQG